MSYSDEGFATGYAVGRDTNGYGNGFGFGGGWEGLIGLVIIAAIFGGGFGGFGFGGNRVGGFNNGYDIGKLATTNDVASGFSTSAILNNLNDLKLGQSTGFANVQQTLCQGFNGVNTSILTSTNAVQSQLAGCCCDLARSIDGVNYNMATNTCTITNAINNSARDIIDNQNANYRAIHDELVANKIEAKNERIAELTQQVNALNLAASQQAQNAYITANQEAQTAELIRRLGRDCPVPAYVVPNPNCCYNPCGFGYNACGTSIQ